MLASGLLRDLIELQSKVVTLGDLNDAQDDWVPQEQVWAAVEAITGREVHVADQIGSVVSLRVTIRQPGPRPDATWRALWDGRILSIEAVLPHPDRDRLVLLCSQGANHG